MDDSHISSHILKNGVREPTSPWPSTLTFVQDSQDADVSQYSLHKQIEVFFLDVRLRTGPIEVCIGHLRQRVGRRRGRKGGSLSDRFEDPTCPLVLLAFAFPLDLDQRVFRIIRTENLHGLLDIDWSSSRRDCIRRIDSRTLDVQSNSRGWHK